MSRHVNQCVGKFRFPTFTEAAKRARVSNKRREGATMNAYRCSWCSGFHIGRNQNPRHLGRRPRLEIEEDYADA